VGVKVGKIVFSFVKVFNIQFFFFFILCFTTVVADELWQERPEKINPVNTSQLFFRGLLFATFLLNQIFLKNKLINLNL
jgi:hypothetical protein